MIAALTFGSVVLLLALAYIVELTRQIKNLKARISFALKENSSVRMTNDWLVKGNDNLLSVITDLEQRLKEHGERFQLDRHVTEEGYVHIHNSEVKKIRSTYEIGPHERMSLLKLRRVPRDQEAAIRVLIRQILMDLAQEMFESDLISCHLITDPISDRHIIETTVDVLPRMNDNSFNKLIDKMFYEFS